MAGKKDSSLYFIALVPPEPYFQQVQELKEEACGLFHTRAALKSPPHITLHMPFIFSEAREGKILNCLEGIAAGQLPIPIFQTGLGAFPPRVIYLNVELTEPLDQFRAGLVRQVRHNLKITNADYKQRPFHPHMTIAFRDLKKSVFGAAWEHFNQKEISFSWVAKEMVLLKHDGKVWEIQCRFEFLSERSTKAGANENSSL